jgi:uncharacterized membrane protein
VPFVRSFKEVWTDRLLLAGETVLAPAAIALVLVLGMSLFVVAALMLPFLLSLVLRQFLPEARWVYIQNITSLVFIGMIALAFLIGPMVRAKRVHRLHWMTDASGTRDSHDQR